jgi:hypothetical protein
MAWRFDPVLVDIVWSGEEKSMAEIAIIDFGSQGSDLDIDFGERENDESIIDQGYRVADGNL